MNYPVIFKLANQDELLYIATQSSFIKQYQLQQAYLTPEDLVVDATGQAYLLHQVQHNHLPAPCKQFTQPELTALVQAHFFALAQTCAIKIQATSIPELFKLLADDGD
ncbi:hypothetical protein WH43_14675 [Rheinheimera sp. KL1]|uniref:DUF4144 family protein n=1 Tax=Rheinheimera sp. KL1 TaxID=1635005 RepID=UPI0006A9C45A|nr:DUF4144 family protein [Rheinheimera sp. KL1]KOO57323.1 hypothetical protein WH43_14675 [Rheinheimera sp. KL1]